MMMRRSIAPMLLGMAVAARLLAQEKAPSAAQTEETPTYPTQLEQVIVDVVVTDKKGVPIRLA